MYPEGLVDITYVDIYATLVCSSPHPIPDGRVQVNTLVYDTAAGAVMLKIAIAEIDISNNKKYFFIVIYKLVKVVYIYIRIAQKGNFLSPNQPRRVEEIL